jgi:hypothetical protein
MVFDQTMLTRAKGDSATVNPHQHPPPTHTGFSVIAGDACPTANGTGGVVLPRLDARLRACGDLQGSPAGTDAAPPTAVAAMTQAADAAAALPEGAGGDAGATAAASAAAAAATGAAAGPDAAGSPAPAVAGAGG